MKRISMRNTILWMVVFLLLAGATTGCTQLVTKSAIKQQSNPTISTIQYKEQHALSFDHAADPHVDPQFSSELAIPPTAQQIFNGIYYKRDLRSRPRLIRTYLVFIDLQAVDLSFLVTPGQADSEHQLQARTTSQFAREFGVQVAINGDGFAPWKDNGPYDYYPLAGDPIDVTGFASSLGTVYSPSSGDEATLYISANNEVSFEKPFGPVYNAISGFGIIAHNGQILPEIYADAALHPRTLAALDATGRTLILAVLDGRQSGHSLGATQAEAAQIMLEYGADTVLNLDGGGTSTLVIEGRQGQPVVKNSPIHAGIPDTERPCANHLGIYASPLE